jgi:hypothetical protein
MMPYSATDGGTSQTMMPGHVSGHSANRSTFDTTGRVGNLCA